MVTQEEIGGGYAMGDCKEELKNKLKQLMDAGDCKKEELLKISQDLDKMIREYIDNNNGYLERQ